MRSLPAPFRRARWGQRGVTTVEFALVFPLVVYFLFGAIDGGRLLIDRCMVSYGAVVGGRVASVRSTTTVAAVQSAVQAAVPFLNLSTSAVTVAISGVAQSDPGFASHGTGSAITVTVTYNYQAQVIPFYNRATKAIIGTSLVRAE